MWKDDLCLCLKQIACHGTSWSTTGNNSALFLRECSLFSFRKRLQYACLRRLTSLSSPLLFLCALISFIFFHFCSYFRFLLFSRFPNFFLLPSLIFSSIYKLSSLSLSVLTFQNILSITFDSCSFSRICVVLRIQIRF